MRRRSLLKPNPWYLLIGILLCYILIIYAFEISWNMVIPREWGLHEINFMQAMSLMVVLMVMGGCFIHNKYILVKR